jgi:hypothetical protein
MLRGIVQNSQVNDTKLSLELKKQKKQLVFLSLYVENKVAPGTAG